VALTLRKLVSGIREYDLLVRPAQQKIDDCILQPRWVELCEHLTRFRDELDVEYRTQAAKRRPRDSIYGELNLADYPLGFCRHIRNGMLKKMQEEVFFRQLAEKGVRIHPVFVLLKDSYFQNAIQIGNTYLDVANDTVDVTKPRLEWAPIREVAYTNLDSWSVFAQVAERYLRVQIFPNYLFPLAFPAVPFFAIRPNGRLDLLCVQNQIFFKDLGRQMAAAKRLLSHPSWRTRRLPQAYEKLVAQRFEANIGEVFPLEYSPASPREIEEGVLAEFAQLNLDRAEDSQTITTYLELIEKAVSQLTMRQILPEAKTLSKLRSDGILPVETHLPIRPNQELIGFDDEA